MLHGKLNQSGKPEGRAPQRMKRSLAGGLVVALSAAALVGLNSGAAVSAAPSATAPVASSESSNSILRAKATKVTVTKVTATSTPITSGTRVATTVGVKNTHSQRMPALTVRLYLTSGAKKYKLGDARVKALSSGASTTVRATHNAPTAAPAGRYAVTACRGAYSVQKCRTSSSTVTIAPARLVSSAAALPLGDASVGSTSAPRVVTVTNRGHANTGTLSAQVVGNSDFSVKSSTCRASLTPGKSCKVSVVFSPEAPGTVIGTLAVSGKFAKPISVALTGNGTGAALTISATAYDFDDTVVGSASAPTEFTVTNTGNVATGALDASLSPETDDFTITASSCAQALAPAATCTVAVAFTPTAAGEQTATLSASGTPGGSVSTAFTGTGLAPASLSVDPEALSFGDELIDETSEPQTLTVTNDGDVASGLPVVTLDGVDADQFTIDSNGCTTALAAGASCDVDVVFAPSAPGVASGVLSVTGAPGESALAALGGVGQTTAALSISESAYDFGYSGDAEEQVLTVTNDGTLTSGSPVVDLDGSSAFDITTDTCTAPLAGGASCTVGVTYTGSGSVEQTAELTVAAIPGGTVSTELSGFPLALTVTPTSRDYGGIEVGEVSDTESYTLTNHRLTSVQMDGETVSGPFVLDTGCIAEVLAAGGTCTFTAHFAPTSAGDASGYIEYAAEGDSARATVSGTGLTPAAFSLSPSTLDFGAYAPGDRGTQQVTVTNTGSQASETTGFSITGSDASEFDTDSTDCPTNLAGGASCTVTVAFAPTSLGDKTAAFDFAGAPGGTASLVGLGAPAGVSLYPTTYDYGSVGVGGTKYYTFRVVNTTDNGEDMNSASSGPPFPLELNQDFSCVLIISTIPAHRWCTMTISFKPQSVGSFNTTLTAGGPGFNTSSLLVGTGVAAVASSRKLPTDAGHLPTSLRLRDGKAEVGYE